MLVLSNLSLGAFCALNDHIQEGPLSKAPVVVLTPKEVKQLRKSLKGQGNINRLKRRQLGRDFKKGIRNA